MREIRTSRTRGARPRAGLLAAAALAAVVGAGAVGGGMLPPPPALAEPLTLERPLVMPSFADVVERVRPAVVSVRVRAQAIATRGPEGFGSVPDLAPGDPLYEFFRRFGEGDPRQRRGGPPPERFAASQGSGFFVSADGYLVTNNHVVENAVEVEVLMDDGRTFDARVVGTDPRTDLAVVEVDADGETFPYVEFAPERSRIGDWVVAIGNPFGLGGTVTAGIVSAEARDIGAGPYDEFMQIDAPINRGNSGGPTFNLRGQVVGVNTAIFSPSGGNVGIAFAIPAHVAQSVTTQLRAEGAVTRGFLGVQVQAVTPEIAEAIGLGRVRGALIAQPQPNTPAADAGLRSGDVILAVDGEAVDDHRDLTRRIAAIAPGTRVEITIFRKGREAGLDVRIGRLGT
ncbi:trypsin-like peptidase domain-containing protein [Salinarimonas rosea]|uniref:trypsin-like peptidase domain-containing protein n=1 Tax=Salinarimonas rosea TaxID=552063 RepID=UPI0003FBD4CB|nr:trypsin-like peptidase domain-containing protein [Salinarimonas rosea]